METQEGINKRAVENYKNKSPWPNADDWHKTTYAILYKAVSTFLKKYSKHNMLILNAGSGGTDYPHSGEIIHLDIVDSQIKQYPNFIVSSIENIPLKDNSIDIIICVGSVLNYADCQKSISEFNRILKPNGMLVLEFERSNSGEFLFTRNHNKTIFSKTYLYNEQKHILWMYNEKNIVKILKLNNLNVFKKKRFHIFSTLLNRFGISEKNAAKYIKLDKIFALLSYPLAHNCILFAKKVSKIEPYCNNPRN